MRTNHFRLAALVLFSLMAPGLLQGQQPKVDVYGDPLPAGAIVRLGTVRWRHGDGTTFLSFLPDGKTLLSVGNDATVRQWDVATGKERRRFGLISKPGGVDFWDLTPENRAILLMGGCPNLVSMDAKGGVLASYFTGAVIYVLDVATGKELWKVETVTGRQLAIALSPDAKQLALHSTDGIIRLYDPTGKETGRFGGNPGKDTMTLEARLVFSHKGRRLASVNRRTDCSNTLFMWDIATGKELGRATGKLDQNELRNVAFSPDDSQLAWMNSERQLVIADAATCTEIRRLSVKYDDLVSFAFRPNGKALVARTRGGPLAVVDISTGKEERTLNAPYDVDDPECSEPGLMAFSPDSRLLALGWGAGAIAVLDFAKGDEVTPADAPRHRPTQVSFNPNGKTARTLDEGQLVRVWDTRSGKQVRSIVNSDDILSKALSKDGRLLVSVGTDGSTIHVQDFATGKQMRSFQTGWPPTARAPAISGDNKLVAVSGIKDEKIVVKVFDVSSGKERHRFPLPVGINAHGGLDANDMNEPERLLFGPDNRTLAALTVSGKVLLWDATTGCELPMIQGPANHEIRVMAFAPQGRSLAVECRDDTPRLYETATGRERCAFGRIEVPSKEGIQKDSNLAMLVRLGFFEGKGAEYCDVALSPDGRLLAHSRPGGAITLWDVATRKELGRLKGHQADVTALSFSDDGKTLASGSRDTTVLLWDVTKFATSAKPQAAKVDAAARWNELRGDDALRAFDAICALAAGPSQAVPFLKEHVRPAAPVDAELVRRLIGDLDSEQFAVRKKASAELVKVGEAAIPLLRKALEGDPTPEARKRIEEVLKKVESIAPGGELLRSLRAIEVLETIATAEAKAVLKDLAKGTAGTTLTRAAQGAVERLGR